MFTENFFALFYVFLFTNLCVRYWAVPINIFIFLLNFLSAASAPGSRWLATLVALNAINMADMADSSLNEEVRVDIYIDCAIQLRSTLPKNLKFLAVSVQHL